MKYYNLAVVCLLVSCVVFALVGCVECCEAEVWYVGGNNPGNFSSLVGVLDEAGSSDVVFCYPSQYLGPFFINKSVSLIGKNFGSNVLFSVEGDISNNHIINILAEGVVLRNLSFFSDNSLVEAVYVHTDDVILSGCVFEGNLSKAVYLKSSKNVSVCANTFNSSNIAIYECCFSMNNSVFHNNFYGAIDGAFITTRGLVWNLSYPLGGNYWAFFDEASEGAFDKNRDGIADEPLQLTSFGFDFQPLMRPWGEQLPVARFSVEEDYDDEMVFDGSDSYDRDGKVVNWSWMVKGGEQFFGQFAVCVFDEPGWYWVNLSVVDDEQQSNFFNDSVWIGPHEPSVELSVNLDGFMLNASAVLKDEGCGIEQIVWDFGDGVVLSGALNQSHTFEQSGVFMVNVSVVDCLGAVGWDSIKIEVVESSEGESSGFAFVVLCCAMVCAFGLRRRVFR